MKRLTLLLLALTLLLSGCGKVDEHTDFDPLAELSEYYGTKEVEEIPPLTTFTLPYRSGETWDPVTCREGVQLTLTALVYEPMFRLDAYFAPRPVLVRQAAYSDDGLRCTLYIRSGVTFSDGTALTEKDVADTLRRAMLSPRYAPRLQQVVSVQEDDGTVVVTLSEPNRSFTALLDIPVVRSGTEHDLVPVGTGPYIPDTGLTQLHYNSAWWQGTALPFEQIALRPYKGEEAAAYAFTSHDVHLFVYEHLSETVLFSAGSTAFAADTTQMHYLGVNMESETLADPALRQLISQLIDRESLVSAVLSGHARAAQFPISPASTLYPAHLETDSSSAAVYETLSSLGLRERAEPIPLRLLVNNENNFKVSAAGNIAAMLNRCGFAVTVEACPWEDYLYLLALGRYDLYYGECRLCADWDLSAMVKEDGVLNYGGYKSEEAAALLDAFRAAEPSQRTAAAEALCLQLQTDVPLIPLYFSCSDLMVTQGAVENAAPTAADPFCGLEDWIVHWGEEDEE